MVKKIFTVIWKIQAMRIAHRRPSRQRVAISGSSQSCRPTLKAAKKEVQASRNMGRTCSRCLADVNDAYKKPSTCNNRFSNLLIELYSLPNKEIQTMWIMLRTFWMYWTKVHTDKLWGIVIIMKAIFKNIIIFLYVEWFCKILLWKISKLTWEDSYSIKLLLSGTDLAICPSYPKST